MQSALDAKAFASITDSVTQLLLLREVLCTSELSATTSASEALQNSATPNHRASGALRFMPLVGHPLYADPAWMQRAKVVCSQHMLDTSSPLPCLESMSDIVHYLLARTASNPEPFACPYVLYASRQDV